MTQPGEPLAFFEAAMKLATDECIEWPFAKYPPGYGVLRYQGRSRNVHAIACELAHGLAPSRRHHAAHGPCHNPSCFNPRHVSWKTASENEADKVRDGTAPLGSRSHLAKLNEEQVVEIRRRRGNGELLKTLAAEFAVSKSTIHAIATRANWGWMS